MSTEETEKLDALLSAFAVAQLTTIDDRYRLVSRPMLPLYTEFDGRLWFFAHRESRVAEHIANRATVNVSFASPKSWLSFAGSADIVHEREIAEALWTTDLAPWFPEGIDPVDASLVEFTADEARYWQSPSAMEALVHLVSPRSGSDVARPRTSGMSLR